MSAAVDTIRRALEQADREDPLLKIINTKRSCFTLLRRAAEIAGPDYAYVGKTSTMDDSKFTPDGFLPIPMNVPRDDGQNVGITIVGLSPDALWHKPTVKQIKVIVNSTDGEIAEGGRGQPARLESYEINEFNQETGDRQYRWHNPPIPQSFLSGSRPPVPQPGPTPPSPVLRLPSYGALGDAAFFVGKVGVPLFEDMHTNGEEMNAGSADWIARSVHGIIERFIQHGDHRDADAIAKKVRNEWRAVMNNPKLPQLP